MCKRHGFSVRVRGNPPEGTETIFRQSSAVATNWARNELDFRGLSAFSFQITPRRRVSVEPIFPPSWWALCFWASLLHESRATRVADLAVHTLIMAAYIILENLSKGTVLYELGLKPHLTADDMLIVSADIPPQWRSRRRSRRRRSSMRSALMPMPKRRSLLSRKLGSMVQRFE